MDRKECLLRASIRVIVLDDDPTGIQTVNGCLVLTDWTLDSLQIAFEDDEPYFFIFTNTRAYSPEEALRIIRAAVNRVMEANQRYHYRLVFICRSDSTLRSHFPLELDAVVLETGYVPEARFFIPAFFEGGRITRADTHYLVRFNKRTPCHETEFSRDSVFGYTTAYLPGYIEEKTNGRVHCKDVHSVSKEHLAPNRRLDLERLLDGIPANSYVVVNVESYSELDHFSDIMVERLARHAVYLFQSAASFVKSLVGCPDKAFVGTNVAAGTEPGLVIMGSHVNKSTRQLEVLLQEPQLEIVEIDVKTALRESSALLAELNRVVLGALNKKKTPVVYTSRKEISLPNKHEQLRAGQRISDLLSQLVAEMRIRPSFLIAKGGITAHEILVNGLAIRYARVLGQAASGVPVIRMPCEHRWAGMPYVIFPGNVGDDDSLRKVFRSLAGSENNFT